MTKAFKVVSKAGLGRYYSLGMGGAKIVEYRHGEWHQGGKCGIAATRTLSAARGVIRAAEKRKILPIPEAMQIVEVSGQGLLFENSWRYTFSRIRIDKEVTGTDDGGSQ